MQEGVSVEQWALKDKDGALSIFFSYNGPSLEGSR
jgi:hypothetical protein